MSRTTLLCLALLLPATAAAQSLQDRYFDSGGVRIHYVDAGSGEPVVLIHGFSANLDVNWVRPRIVAALVDAGYRVIAYDDRGQGQSDKPHDPAAYGVPEVQDVVRLLDRLGIARADIVGYSRGGIIGMELWAMHPERVRTLVLAASPAGARAGSGLLQDEVADSVAAGDPGPLLRWLAPSGSRTTAGRTDTVPTAFRRMWQANDFAALAAILRAPPFPDIPQARLHANTTPALAIVGQYDGLKPAVDALVARMRGTEEVVIPGANHLTAVGDPAFGRALLDFLAAHADGTGSRP